VDYEKAGVIVDDDIHAALVAKLPDGVRLTVIMDCCHSGSILDLPYTYGVDGNDDIIETDNRKAIMDAAMAAGMSLIQGNKEEAMAQGLKALKLHFMAPKSEKGTTQQSLAPTDNQIKLRSTLADVIQFSGCRDTQTSADATIGGKATGALSWSIIEAFKQHGHDQTYVDLLKNIRSILQGKYTQVPQMSTGHKMDMKTTFVM
jgi:metacaspase-1